MTPVPSPSPVTPLLAQQAYDDAVELFKKQHAKDDSKRKWLDNHGSLEQVQAAVELAQAQYEAQPQSKARRSLAKLSDGLVYYGRMMDMLAQHHPEYTAKAWGTMKLMFVLVMNDEELVAELAKALSCISDVLPRIEIPIELYPADAIKASVEGLYAHLVSFYARALRWYQASRVQRAVGVVSNARRLQFEDLVEAIRVRSRTMQSLAIAVAHKQIRSMYVILNGCMAAQTRAEMEHGKAAGEAQNLNRYNQYLTNKLQHMHRTLISHQSVNSGILLSTQQNIKDTQVALMIASTTSPLTLPMDSLRQCRSFCRRQTQDSGSLDKIWKSQVVWSWSTSADSALMVVIGSIPLRAITRMAGTYMVDLVKQTSIPVLWALKASTRSATEGSFTGLIKYLAMQALQLHSGTVASKISPQFNAARVASCTTDEDWLFVLQTALSDFSMVYLVIDAEVLGTTARNKAELTQWVSIMQRVVEQQSGIVLKVVLLSYRRTSMSAALQTRLKASHTNVLHLDRILQTSSAHSMPTPSRALRSKSAVAFQRMVVRSSQKRAQLPTAP